MFLLSLYCAPLTSMMFSFFGFLPFSCLTPFQAWFMGVFLLRKLAYFSRSSFLFFFARVLNSELFFFHWMECCSRLVFLNISLNRALLSLSFCSWLLHKGLGKCCFISITGIADFAENLIFFYEIFFVRTSFHASFKVKRCNFALLMFHFVILV